MSDWISVKDKKPEIEVLVLIAVSSSGLINYDFAKWNGDYWTRKAWPLGYEPTHWCELPAPPK